MISHCFKFLILQVGAEKGCTPIHIYFLLVDLHFQIIPCTLLISPVVCWHRWYMFPENSLFCMLKTIQIIFLRKNFLGINILVWGGTNHYHKGYGWCRLKVKLLSHIRLFGTLWTVAHQNSPSMGFSRQEYWSGVPMPSPGDWIMGQKSGKYENSQVKICRFELKQFL